MFPPPLTALTLPILACAVLAAPASLPANATALASAGAIDISSASCRDIDGCRTLLNIVWSCVATVLICVWVAVHRDVPAADDGWLARQLGSVLLPVVMTVLAPEWTLGWAVDQFFDARKLAKKLEEARQEARRGVHRDKNRLMRRSSVRSADEETLASYPRRKSSDSQSSDDEKETLVHGGLGPGDAGEEIVLTTTGAAWRLVDGMKPLDRAWTTTHAFFVLSDGFFYFDASDRPIRALTPGDVLEHVKSGTLVPPTVSELKDRSKGDGFSKGFAIVQTLWFVIQCIARRLERLPMTQLEVMTLAYTTTTIAIYAFWWNKPLNVACPIRVPGTAAQTAAKGTFATNSGRVPFVAAILSSIAFGTVHCVAWTYAFPTTAERLLWRASAVTILGIPLLVAVWALFDECLPDGVETVLGVLALVIYVVARLILSGLSFSTLRSLSHEVYRTVQWTQLIPHL